MTQVTAYTNEGRYKCLEDLPIDSAELSLGYCGWERCYPGHRFGPNKRTYYVLHIITNGKGKLEKNGEVFHLTTGDAFLLCPEEEAWYEADKKEPWAYAWIGLYGYKVKKVMQYAGFSKEKSIRSLKCTALLKSYVDEILEVHRLTTEESMRRNGYLNLFLATLIEDNEKFNTKTMPEHTYPGTVYVEHAMEYIKHHYREKIKINELAEYIGINRSYLTNMFKKTIGCSPQEYLVKFRMEKAKNLLKNTDMPINAVAEAVGYPDQLAFSKMFRIYTNISPKAFRQTKEELVFENRKGAFHGEIG